MNKSIVASLVIASGLTLTTSPVFAERVAHRPHAQAKHRDPGINHRQHHQNERIRQGVRSGELTRAEVKDLNQQRRGIRQEERAYKADGHMTRAERRDLHQDMNALSKDIYNEKHDAETRHDAH